MSIVLIPASNAARIALTVTSYQVPAVPVISFIVGGNTTPRAAKALVAGLNPPPARTAAGTVHCSLI